MGVTDSDLMFVSGDTNRNLRHTESRSCSTLFSIFVKSFKRMSEFTQHKNTRIEQLIALFNGILKGENLGEVVKENQKVIESCIPSDVIYLVDKLVLMEIPMKELKKGINKIAQKVGEEAIESGQYNIIISGHTHDPPSATQYKNGIRLNDGTCQKCARQAILLFKDSSFKIINDAAVDSSY